MPTAGPGHDHDAAPLDRAAGHPAEAAQRRVGARRACVRSSPRSGSSLPTSASQTSVNGGIRSDSHDSPDSASRRSMRRFVRGDRHTLVQRRRRARWRARTARRRPAGPAGPARRSRRRPPRRESAAADGRDRVGRGDDRRRRRERCVEGVRAGEVRHGELGAGGGQVGGRRRIADHRAHRPALGPQPADDEAADLPGRAHDEDHCGLLPLASGRVRPQARSCRPQIRPAAPSCRSPRATVDAVPTTSRARRPRRTASPPPT